MEEALEETTQTTSPRPLLEVLKASELTKKRKLHVIGDSVRQNSALQQDYIEISLMNPHATFQSSPACIHVHSGHIHVSSAFLSAFFLRIIGDFLLNNGVDIKE